MDRFTENFRTALIRARRESGFSQAGIALKIGINISTYNGFETGKAYPYYSNCPRAFKSFKFTEWSIPLS